MIKYINYPTNNILLTHKLLGIHIEQFWKEIFTPIINESSSKHLFLMSRVEFEDSSLGHRTLGHLRIVNFDDKELFINYLQERLGIISDAYTVHPIKNITFSYIIKEGLATGENRRLLKDLSSKTITTHRFNNLTLPISMLPQEYGSIFAEQTFDSFTRYAVTDNIKTYQIDISLDGLTNNVRLIGQSDLNWIDTKLTEGGFKREIGKSTIYFLDGEIILRKQELAAKPFRKLSLDKELVSNFITMDIETTTNSKGKVVPYLICAYNGSEYITSYLNEQEGQKELFHSFITQLIALKGNSKLVYAHNLSGFDGIYLMKHLFSFGKVKPVLFNGKLMSIKLTLKKGKTITFNDSYLMLPRSLRKLCVAFNVTATKGYFPFLISNILYSGVLPAIQYWKGIPLDIYEGLLQEFTGKTWSFKEQSIKYCKLDCKALHEVLKIFNSLIFKQFKINITRFLTLPALAMGIYKSNFMPKDTIFQLLSDAEIEIRESYTGGAVDNYIPHNVEVGFFAFIKKVLRTLYYYDVNSLYPTVMANFDVPIGKPIRFEGNILSIEPSAYGFFYCRITTPDYIEHPLLQRRIKTKDGLRTIAGLGTWEGWIFSEEMLNAIKFGYTFEVLRGYQFKRGNIFKQFIETMYNLRLEYPKAHPMNLIAKLLMNSLYGKFAMKLESTELFIYDCSTEVGKKIFQAAMDLYNESIQDYVQLENTFLIIRDSMIDLKYNEKEDMYHGLDVNVGIASAITAQARIYMSVFKNNPLIKLYYSDTDSAVVGSPLPEHMVGEKLGQLKLEYVIKKAVFLAPKVYGLETIEGNKIIHIKGVTTKIASELSLNDLAYLLIDGSGREYNQDKWYKNFLSGEISIKDIAYTLKVTSNKRQPIYINSVFSGSKPYNYNDLI